MVLSSLYVANEEDVLYGLDSKLNIIRKIQVPQPSAAPTAIPTRIPTRTPFMLPPSSQPTGQPSRQPTSRPSCQPTTRPSGQPSSLPTRLPSTHPSGQPTSRPSSQPTSRPTGQPSTQPSHQPTTIPTSQPSGQPTSSPMKSKYFISELVSFLFVWINEISDSYETISWSHRERSCVHSSITRSFFFPNSLSDSIDSPDYCCSHCSFIYTNSSRWHRSSNYRGYYRFPHSWWHFNRVAY
jgi:hypothetical protein